jgi:hypothetical protein
VCGLARQLMILLLSASLGLHWDLLQTVGWATMLAQRVPQEGVVEALKTTFDGQHPCRICLLVREGRQAETDPADTSAPQKLKLERIAPAATAFALSEPGRPVARFASPEIWFQRLEPPPFPPPRAS